MRGRVGGRGRALAGAACHGACQDAGV